VLVVGVSPDVDQRCEFEHVLARQIQSASTTAIASCDVVTQKDPLTRETIDQAIVAQKADGVVATILVSKKWDTQEGGTRDTRGAGYYKATDVGYAGFGAYGVPAVYGDFRTESSIITLKGKVEVTSKVYETRGATLIYTDGHESIGPGVDQCRSRHGRGVDRGSAVPGRADPLARNAPGARPSGTRPTESHGLLRCDPRREPCQLCRVRRSAGVVIGTHDTAGRRQRAHRSPRR
jgi:hypothetical protein